MRWRSMRSSSRRCRSRRPDDTKLARAGIRPDVSQSGRACGRLRQECRGAGRAVPAWLRLRRGRRRHAAAAARQSASAPVPARCRSGRHQPARAEQRGCGGGRAAARGAQGRAASSASTSAPTRIRPTAPPIMSPASTALAPHVDFLTVNVSSPNTPGLRNLQQASALDDLLSRVIDARERAAEDAARKPLLLKIAPDLTLSDLDDVVGVARRHAHRRHDRRQHHDQPAESARRPRRRKSRAGSRAVRCSRSRPACWRRPTCAPKARSR